MVPDTLKPLKRGHTNDFGSSRSLNNWFCGLGRKSGFGLKLSEAGRTFFSHKYRNATTTLVTSFDMIQYAVDVSSIVQAKTISLEFTTFSTTAYTQHLKKETRIAKA